MAIRFLVIQWRMRRRWSRRRRRRWMSQTQGKIPVIDALWFTVGREVDRHLINVIVSINVITILIEKIL